MVDYYTLLGAEQTDDAAAIKKKYHALAKKHHPDLHPGDLEAAEYFKQINEAWEMLGDTEKRAEYDAKRTESKGGKKKSARSAPVGDVDFNDLMGRFDSFFGKATQQPGAGEKNPLDGTDLFERFMGVKK